MGHAIVLTAGDGRVEAGAVGARAGAVGVAVAEVAPVAHGVSLASRVSGLQAAHEGVRSGVGPDVSLARVEGVGPDVRWGVRAGVGDIRKRIAAGIHTAGVGGSRVVTARRQHANEKREAAHVRHPALTGAEDNGPR